MAVDDVGRAYLVDAVRPLHPEGQMVAEMLQGRRNPQLSRKLQFETIDARVKQVQRFIEHSNEFPWTWTVAMVDEFFGVFAVSTNSPSRRSVHIRSACDSSAPTPGVKYLGNGHPGGGPGPPPCTTTVGDASRHHNRLRTDSQIIGVFSRCTLDDLGVRELLKTVDQLVADMPDMGSSRLEVFLRHAMSSPISANANNELATIDQDIESESEHRPISL